ncbi:MAG: lipopolysaccharide heptosyltransferase II [Thermodesulfovibrio sp.]|nr:lipopolysaccharide heptosyltransferase II [Thermodesulfovibrio sp.]
MMLSQRTVTPEKCDNILIRGVNWVGDAVMTMPALRSVRQTFPDARISLLVKPAVSPLFEHDPNVDEIISYGDEYQGLSGRIRLARLLKQRCFSRAFLLQNAFDAALTAFLAKIPERVGYKRDGRQLLLTRGIAFDTPAKELHHIDYYLNLLRKSGMDPVPSLPWIYLLPEERLAAREKLQALRRPVIALNPGAAYGSSKRWPPVRFAEVASGFIREKNAGIIILGGPKETAIAAEIEQGIRQLLSAAGPSGTGEIPVINFAGKTTLRELAALISEADLLITNDSGPMHIGYAVRTPLVAIFGSTSPQHTGPVGRDVAVLKKDIDCSPCFERKCRRKDLRCMEMISAAEVYEAGLKLIKTERAVFFDRDGTLCRDAHYLARMEDFELLPGMDELRLLKDRGFRLIGITNQSGIARGRVKEDFVRDVNNIFIRRYGFDAFYYCPHHPDEHCSCRKPEPGLLYEARADYAIDLKQSFMVGDKNIDMLLAASVGATGIHVRTGQEGQATAAEQSASDLKEVVRLIHV